jgi:hypothetical protein
MAPLDYLSLLNNAKTAGTGTSAGQQPAAASGQTSMQPVLNSIVAFALSSMDSNADKTAEQEVKDGEQKINNIDKAKETAAQQNMAQIGKILEMIEANRKSAEEKLKAIDDTNKEKEELQKKLDAASTQVEIMKKKVNSSEYTPAEKRAFLKSISESGKEIQELAEQCNALSEKVNSTNAEVEEISGNNQNLTAQSEEEANKGNAIQRAYAFQLSGEITKQNAATAAQAAQNTSTAVAAEAKAAALETGGTIGGMFTAGATTAAAQAKAAELHQVAAANFNAATIRGTGTALNNTRIGASITGIGQNTQNITAEDGKVVGVGSDITNKTDEYNAISRDLTGLDKKAEQLQTGATIIESQVLTADGAAAAEEQKQNVQGNNDVLAETKAAAGNRGTVPAEEKNEDKEKSDVTIGETPDLKLDKA